VKSTARAAVVVAALSLSAWPGAQSLAPPAGPQTREQGDRPLFRAGVELIQLDVSVLDGKRQPVRGLSMSDFTVLEDGVPRPLRAFTAVDLPVRDRPSEPVWGASTPPDVATNQVAEQDGRLVIILMDRSIQHDQPAVAARKIATAAVESLGPHDLGALVSTSGGVPQNLTADRTRLITAINHPDWSTDSDVNPWTPDSTLSDGRCLCGLCVLETVTRIADAVRNAPRKRKVLLFIGRGVVVQTGPRPPSTDVGCESRVRDARRTMFDSLALSNLTVHSIDPLGVVNLGPQTRATVGGAKGGPDNAGPAARLRAQLNETNELLLNQSTLRVLPERTGGRTILNTNTPEEKIPEIFRESEAYYVLGFERGTRGLPDARRSIEVKVGRKGVQVHAQRQYVQPPNAKTPPSITGSATAPASLETALSGLLPAAGRPLTLAIAAFAGAQSAKPSVSVTVDVGRFARGDDAPVPLDIAVVALDRTGRQVAFARQTSTVAFPRARPGGTVEAAVQTHLELAAGNYDVRVGVSDPATGVVASVFSHVAVPEFGGAPLSLSDVSIEALSTDAAKESTTLRPPVTTTRRVFHHDDRVQARLQIYEGTEGSDAIVPVSVRARVLDAQGRAVRDQSLVIAEKAFANRRAGCQIAVDVEHLPPGEYLLRFDAAMGNETTGRALRFAVR
jgi:VWFA-related protein